MRSAGGRHLLLSGCGKSHPWPFSTKSTGGKAEVFHSRRASHRALQDFFRSLLAMVFLAACGPGAAHGQGSLWEWGTGARSDTAWSPEQFADYLGTGQTPHPAVARIVAPERSGTSMGTGVLVDVNRTQGLVLTNWHVIRSTRSAVLVQFPDGFQSAGTVVRFDEPWDLAAIAIWKPNALPISLAPQPPQVGEPLTIAGYGRGSFRAQTGPCTQYLAPGTGYPLEFVELQATARQGDSGGPILNARGELSGVLFGQTEGRTVGSCSTRLRAFLAGVGSQGFSAAPLALASRQQPVAGGPVSPPRPESTQLTAAIQAHSEPPQPPAETPAEPVPAPALPPDPPGLPAALQRRGQVAVGQPQPPVPAAAAPAFPLRPTGDSLEEVFDISTNGRALLAALGGIVLACFGLRAVWRGRGS